MTPSSDVNRGDWLTALAALAFVLVTRANGEILALVVTLVVVIVCFFAMRKMHIRQGVALLILIVLIFGAANSWRARQELRDVTTGSYAGIAKVMSDPRNVGYATRIVLEIERDRFVVYAYGSPAWRLAGARVGEQVFVRGYREEFEPGKQSRWVSQHVKGRFQVVSVAEQRFAASPLLRSAQRVRDLVSASASSFNFDERNLFTGLVIGDDTKQSEEMVSAFRKSGLAHLVAVSGQNVAFVLAALSPLLRRLNRRWRTSMTIFILIWFVVITRIEPSVVRAALMAGAAYLSVAMGRPTRTLRLIALTVFAAIAVDPLLAWSVGYFMSVGATLGLCLGAEKLEKLIRGPQWLARLLSATLSAQFGVIPVVIFVFGVPSAFGIVANVLAVPIAGLVMLIGLPLGLFTGVLENLGRSEFATVLMWPVQIGVRWVWWVAEIFARLSVGPVFNLGLWIAVLIVLLALRHRSARV